MLKFEKKYYRCLSSTNSALIKQAKKGLRQGKVIIAGKQKQGKGSKNRCFYSAYGGLYFSVLLRPNIAFYQYLTPLVAVATAKAIEKLGFENIKIKWVNDIFYNDKKVCGILTEGGFDAFGKYYAVVGIGINLSKPKKGFASDIKETATYLYPTKTTPQLKNQLLDAILNNIAYYYKEIEKKEYLAYYKQKSYLDGKQIQVTLNGKTFDSMVVGISQNFELLVKNTSGEIISLNSADVQVKTT
ncbi:MAG: biotin--[acetyl-CoA-carboxylase] ligase [Clostridiales bacterium]|nr:biotin--[acetyl-CoA-carboxylase] ligase [Clostridiales bacterium]